MARKTAHRDWRNDALAGFLLGAFWGIVSVVVSQFHLLAEPILFAGDVVAAGAILGAVIGCLKGLEPFYRLRDHYDERS
jgi:hypothetical protein